MKLGRLREGPGLERFEYSPDLIGDHAVDIRFDGEHIPRSPFTVPFPPLPHFPLPHPPTLDR